MTKENDPFKCLRCTSIAVGIWNIIYCLIQFGLLGWQVQVVKEWQWHWENRELPATGAIDQYQARFPGLYAMYTETPESRKINALFAIVLICLGLNIAHLPNSIAMLYGCNKGIGVVLVFLYYQRLRGKLVSERAGNGYLPSISITENNFSRNSKINKIKLKENLYFEQQIPPWIKSLPDKPPKAIERKLRRNERKEEELGRRYEIKRGKRGKN
uniref:Uncharacterized protein n=1 Tax=Meloidogyne hapla TaxID=6305 RepID=A0A1I8BGV0_MELHA